MFRPYKVTLRPSKKTDPRVVYVSLHCGIPNVYKFLLEKCKIHKLVYVAYVFYTTCWTSNRPARAHYFLLALQLPRSNPTRYKYPAQSCH